MTEVLQEDTMEIGQKLYQFQIVAKLGEGGMGDVYRARDSRLGREVAIKVLPEKMANNPDRLARFEREAQAVAKLSHPNILDVYEFGDHAGRPFMVTELLEGETLHERLGGGALDWRKAAEIGSGIADGLSAAHESGIYHRDLKPSNIFITADGRVKVLDFGLAKLEDAGPDNIATHAPTLTRQTEPGTVLGTVGYMSPEQVRGESVDQRSDIFSLGCVLYEMIVGERAFTGDSAVETMNAILKEEPEGMSTASPKLPTELGGLVRRCLEKNPLARFQSASDLAYNLRTISSASAPPAARELRSRTKGMKKAVWIVGAVTAVLVGAALTAYLRSSRFDEVQPPEVGTVLEWVAVAPLENRTGDASLDPLGQRAVDLIIQRFSEVGLADGVLTMDNAPYPPRQTSAREDSRRRTRDQPAIKGKGPHVLVSGAYYLDSEELEFQTQLTDYDTGGLLHAFEPVHVPRGEAARALVELRERVVVGVAVHWGAQHDIRLISPPSSFEAWTAYSLGWNSFGSDDDPTIDEFGKALELDPDFHHARFFLIVAYSNNGRWEEAEREFSAAERRQHDLTSFERAFFGWCRAMLDEAPMEVLKQQRLLVKLAPHIPWTRFELGRGAIALNRLREGVEALDPVLPVFGDEFHPTAHWGLPLALGAYHQLEEHERELEWADIGLKIYPDVGELYYYKGAALVGMGRIRAVDAVVDECTRVQLRDSAMDAGWVMANLALEHRAHGHRLEGEDLARRSADWYDRHAGGVQIHDREARALHYHAWALRIANRVDEARTLLLELRRREVRSMLVAGTLGVIAAQSGDREEARRIFNELLLADSPSRFYWLASIASYLGEKDHAVELLRESFANGRAHESYDHIDVNLEPLWDYPPFRKLLEPRE